MLCSLANDVMRLTSATTTHAFNPSVVVQRSSWHRAFRGNAQHDADEAFTKLIEQCDLVDNRSLRRLCAGMEDWECALTTDFLGYTTPAWKIFGFMFRNVITCEACGKVTRSLPNPINRLQVPMAGSSNLILKELIENDLRDEPLRDNDRCGDAKWQENNSGCGTRNCRSMGKAILWWPDVLVVHLKRFEPNATRTGFRKIDRPVCYGKNLQVLDSPEYTLRAMVMHHGSYGHGHYTDCVRTEEDKWILCDDAQRPKPMIEAQVFPQQRDSLIYSKAYIFFYERTSGRAEHPSAPPAPPPRPPRTDPTDDAEPGPGGAEASSSSNMQTALPAVTDGAKPAFDASGNARTHAAKPSCSSTSFPSSSCLLYTSDAADE